MKIFHISHLHYTDSFLYHFCLKRTVDDSIFVIDLMCVQCFSQSSFAKFHKDSHTHTHNSRIEEQKNISMTEL